MPLFITWRLHTTIIAYSLIFFAYALCANNNTCSLDLYNEDVQTSTVLFTCDASSHKTDWILTTRCLLCLASLYAYVNDLINVLDVKCSWLRLLENSRSFIVVCVFYFQSLLLAFPFILKFFVFVTSVYDFNVKRCYTVSLFVTIQLQQLKAYTHYIGYAI